MFFGEKTAAVDRLEMSDRINPDADRFHPCYMALQDKALTKRVCDVHHNPRVGPRSANIQEERSAWFHHPRQLLADPGQPCEIVRARATVVITIIGDAYVVRRRRHDDIDRLRGSCLEQFEAIAKANSLISHLPFRSEEHTSELQSLMRISYAVFGLKKKK